MLGEPVLILRRFEAHEWATYRDTRLRALADAPDAFGSTLAFEKTLSEATWQERLTLGALSPLQFPLVAEVAGEPVGLAWGRIDEETPRIATLYQMWVAPQNRGNGVGAAMLRTLIAWATAADAEYLYLSVTCGNSAAYHLYTRMGFTVHGPPEALRANSALLAQPMRLELRRVV